MTTCAALLLDLRKGDRVEKSWGGRWWRWEELNLRHGAYETPALPLSYTADRYNNGGLAKRVYLTGC